MLIINVIALVLCGILVVVKYLSLRLSTSLMKAIALERKVNQHISYSEHKLL